MVTVKNSNTMSLPDLHLPSATDFIIANADVTKSMKTTATVESSMIYPKPPPSPRKRSRAGGYQDLPIRQKSSAPDRSPRSPPRTHKRSRVDGHHELPVQRSPTPPAPLSGDAARLLHLLKEDPVSWWTASVVVERHHQRKPASENKRSQDPDPAVSRPQYAPQSSATATHPMPEIGIRPSVGSEFGLPFKISEEKIRKRGLPSAIEVSERGADSAYYTQTPADIDVNTSKMASAQFWPKEQAKEGENQLGALHNAQLGGHFPARSTRSKGVHAQELHRAQINGRPTAHGRHSKNVHDQLIALQLTQLNKQYPAH
ncbi:MAG: hypothetical protein Q9226_002971 [Calogaya cf. arnoldii]